jgi:hypothetical protein
MQGTYSSLPYAIHRAYGDAALTVLESAIQKSGYVWVQTSCARELVQAGRKSGFAFIAQAIEQNKFYRREIVQFVQDAFRNCAVLTTPRCWRSSRRASDRRKDRTAAWGALQGTEPVIFGGSGPH